MSTTTTVAAASKGTTSSSTMPPLIIRPRSLSQTSANSQSDGGNGSNNNNNGPPPKNVVHQVAKEEQVQAAAAVAAVAAAKELEEGVLRDVLQELDRERKKRAELEAQLRAATEQQQQQQQQSEKEQQQQQQKMQASGQNDSTKQPANSATTPPMKKKGVAKAVSPKDVQADVVAMKKSVGGGGATWITVPQYLSRKDYIALRAELDGYRQLVDAMTESRPAIAASIEESNEKKFLSVLRKKSSSSTKIPTLPLHVVRMLEIMPWDSKAQQYAFATEEIYEWQIYDHKRKLWQSEIRYFTGKNKLLFSSLPVSQPEPGICNIIDNNDQDDDDSMINRSNNRKFGASAIFVAAMMGVPPQHCVLTNRSLTRRLDIKSGYPLPNDGGTWRWVGGWRVDKRQRMPNTPPSSPTALAVQAGDEHDNNDGEDGEHIAKQTIDCDDNGWSYAAELSHFLINPAELCWDNAGDFDQNENEEMKDKDDTDDGVKYNPSASSESIITRGVRRRKWNRKRVLVDYPYASEQTKQFLKLLAENASLTIATNKISDQLVETKVQLTETESQLLSSREKLVKQNEQLQEVLNERDQLLSALSDANGGDTTSLANNKNNVATNILKSEQVREFKSVLSKWGTTISSSASSAVLKTSSLSSSSSMKQQPNNNTNANTTTSDDNATDDMNNNTTKNDGDENEDKTTITISTQKKEQDDNKLPSSGKISGNNSTASTGSHSSIEDNDNDNTMEVGGAPESEGVASGVVVLAPRIVEHDNKNSSSDNDNNTNNENKNPTDNSTPSSISSNSNINEKLSWAKKFGRETFVKMTQKPPVVVGANPLSWMNPTANQNQQPPSPSPPQVPESQQQHQPPAQVAT